jgi:hypothetical protein
MEREWGRRRIHGLATALDTVSVVIDFDTSGRT